MKRKRTCRAIILMTAVAFVTTVFVRSGDVTCRSCADWQIDDFCLKRRRAAGLIGPRRSLIWALPGISILRWRSPDLDQMVPLAGRSQRLAIGRNGDVMDKAGARSEREELFSRL